MKTFLQMYEAAKKPRDVMPERGLDPAGWLARADLAEERGEKTLPYAKKLLNDFFRQVYQFLQNLVAGNQALRPTLTTFNMNHVQNFDEDVPNFVGAWLARIDHWAQNDMHVMELYREAAQMCGLLRRSLADYVADMQLNRWSAAIRRLHGGLSHDLTEALRLLREASPRRRDAKDRMYRPIFQHQLTPPGDGEQIDDDGWPVADAQDVNRYYAAIAPQYGETHQFFNLLYQKLRPNMTRRCRNAGARYIKNWYMRLSLA